jgi:hypothetical protein
MSSLSFRNKVTLVITVTMEDQRDFPALNYTHTRARFELSTSLRMPMNNGTRIKEEEQLQ